MTTENNPQPKTRSYIIGGFLAVLGLSTVFGAQAYSNSRLAGHIGVEKDFSGSYGKIIKTGWRHSGPRFGEMSATEREKHVTRIIKHVAVEIDASDAQQTQLVALITELAGEMMPLREKMLADREEVIKLLTAPVVDRAALEALRTTKLAEADEVSKKLVDAVADAAEILTAEQRKTVAERVEEFSKMRRGWRH